MKRETFKEFSLRLDEGNIPSLDTNDNKIYNEAVDLFQKEYEKFIASISPKLSKIIEKMSDEKQWIGKTNLADYMREPRVNVSIIPGSSGFKVSK